MISIFLKYLKFFSLLIAILFFVASLLIFYSREKDSRKFGEIAFDQTKRVHSDSERILTLNRWVYHNKGFEKNQSYFLFQALGATPLQILEFGGDCADKSRLLMAMLSEINIPSTLAMLYPCPDCPPGHTVVEAKYEKGWMVVDPVFDIDFPDDKGGFYGLSLLRQKHKLLVTRIQQLCKQRGKGDKIERYDVMRTKYIYARTVNWNKNIITKSIAFILSWFYDDPFLIRRPRFLDDPKLAIISVCITIFIFFIVLYAVIRKIEFRTKIIISKKNQIVM